MEFFDSLRELLLSKIFGTGAVITSVPTTLGPQETQFVAARPITPVEDYMEVSIGLGASTQEARGKVLTGKLDSRDAASVKVQICTGSRECMELIYQGAYFSNDFYGYIFAVSGKAVRGGKFRAVRLSAVRSLEIFEVRWKNYQK
jgi:hypothetical protein